MSIYFITVFALSICDKCGFIPNNQQTPMLGWSSWSVFNNINETVIKETADAMVKNGMMDAGYRYINIDDGYFGERDADGKLQCNATNFPGGMKALVKYIHSLGLNAGIYTAAGKDACGGSKGVGLLGHEEEDARLLFGDWDYDFLKLDFCDGLQNSVDTQARCTTIRQFMAMARPERMVRLNICGGKFPGSWVTELADSWRMSKDIADRFIGKGTSVVAILRQNLYLSAYASPGHFNDMNVMAIGRGTFTEDEEKAHFGLWSILASPILIGCDLRSIPASTLEIITNSEVLAVHQDVLGLQARVVNITDTSVVLAKPLGNPKGSARAVALFNWGAKAAEMRVDFADVFLKGLVHIRDLYTHTNLPDARSFFVTTVPSHGIALLRLEADAKDGGALDRTVYDGQDVFLNEYSHIPGSTGAATVEWKDGSSGLKIISLGNSPNNWCEFRNIYSQTSGRHTLSIEYYSEPAGRGLEVYVNGVLAHSERLKGPDMATKQTVRREIELWDGENIIRLANENGWAPDINRIVVKPYAKSLEDEL